MARYSSQKRKITPAEARELLNMKTEVWMVVGECPSAHGTSFTTVLGIYTSAALAQAAIDGDLNNCWSEVVRVKPNMKTKVWMVVGECPSAHGTSFTTVLGIYTSEALAQAAIDGEVAKGSRAVYEPPEEFMLDDTGGD